jgi:hypothetical protein
LTYLLAEARRAGESFDQAWDRIIRPGRGAVLTCTPNPPPGVVLWPSDTKIRKAERQAISEP